MNDTEKLEKVENALDGLTQKEAYKLYLEKAIKRGWNATACVLGEDGFCKDVDYIKLLLDIK